MRETIVILLVVFSVLCGCSKNSENELYQSKRDKVIEVKQLIKPIDFGDVFMSSSSVPIIADSYLIIGDGQSYDKTIHVFDKNTFEHVVSFGDFGPGPNEITELGYMVFNEYSRELYVTDWGKMQILNYCLDSLINDATYKSNVKANMNVESFPWSYFPINDSLSFGRFLNPTGESGYTESTGIWNINTGESKLLEYTHPDIHKKRTYLAVSPKNELYAELNSLYDLISIFNFNGVLQKNVYGPQWKEKELSTFAGGLFAKDKLVALYNGEQYGEDYPINKCIIFSKTGDYIATLNIGYNTVDLCYDAENDRLIFSFDDVIQFGYLNLSDLNLE